MLKDKKGIIFGVANKRSIAWATAHALHEAELDWLSLPGRSPKRKRRISLTRETMPGSPLHFLRRNQTRGS